MPYSRHALTLPHSKHALTLSHSKHALTLPHSNHALTMSNSEYINVNMLYSYARFHTEGEPWDLPPSQQEFFPHRSLKNYNIIAK